MNFRIIFIILLMFLGIIFVLRRIKPWPCPSWLSWLLENPYMKAAAGSSLILERINLNSGMRLLDVGCGPGRITIPAAEKVGSKGLVVAFDMQKTMLEKLKKRVADSGLKNVRTILGTIDKATLKNNYFDRAILVTVLGEIRDREKALSVIYKALKKNGIISITEVFPDPDYQSRHKVKKLAETAGFRFDRRYGSFPTFTMNFIK
ncbi:MAG: class I SAM-dependent methyltransferase [Sedimentisphaerales bacterium]|nr:class I SAM-dependent methyltransferase [Sedimentisphaerales bacterium]